MEIKLFWSNYARDLVKDRKDASYVKYSYNGMEIHIVLVVTIS